MPLAPHPTPDSTPSCAPPPDGPAAIVGSSASEGASRGPTSPWQGRSSLGADRSGRRAVMGVGLAVAASLIALVVLGSAAVLARSADGAAEASPRGSAGAYGSPAQSPARSPNPPAA